MQNRLSKAERREVRRNRRKARDREQAFDNVPVREYTPAIATKPLEAQTEAQAHYILTIERNKLTFGIGPAGTGKTYVCGAMAAEALRNRETDALILTRPAVDAGESLGFLPGELLEKYEPYIQPFRDVLHERLGRSQVDAMIKSGRIIPAPLAYMRGRTFKNCWVILDEAQNTTPKQMKMFLTRIGENCKVIVNGDISQSDIGNDTGLGDAIRRLGRINRVGMVEFTVDDVVRSGLVKEILRAYED